jgi:DNA invertase Pin-like site-specific DNA recombinase
MTTTTAEIASGDMPAVPGARHHPLVTPRHLARPAVVYIRQSTLAQVTKNIGSALVQRDQCALAQMFGWSESSIVVIDEDLGRSGSSTELRTGWQRMTHLIATNQVGAVFIPNSGRMSRQALDSEELRILCLHHDALLVIDDHVVDQQDPNDVAMAQIKATFAQLDNRLRTGSMTRARKAKARSGHVVSRLPVGWIKRPDGTFAFDPEVQAIIAEIFARFWEAGSARALVRLLDQEGKPLPARHGHRLIWKRPDAQAVRFMLVNPAYAGLYRYGVTESRPELGLRPNGHSRRAPTPRDTWITNSDRLPAYVTPEEQQRIRDRLHANQFPRGPGRGVALLQGVIACGRCDRVMSVLYKDKHRYHCLRESTSHGGKICTAVVGPAVDAAVELIFLKGLAAPPVEMLRKALADAHAGEARRVEEVADRRRRLDYDVRIARDRYNNCDPFNRRVAADLEAELERTLEARDAFEQQLAMQLHPPRVEGSEQELQQHVRVAASVPAVWRHPKVTPRDRKELLRCLIKRVLVSTSDDRVDGTIVWHSGARTPFYLHRRAGVYELVKRLHTEGRTVREIQQWLAAGDPDTGQQWHYVRKHIYVIHETLGLRPNERRAYRADVLEQVRRLHDQGLRARAVADKLNASGLTTPLGRPWTKDSVRHALKPVEKRFNRRRRNQVDR